MLSSFINRRKVKKISLFDAALGRAPSSPSLEIQSDRENSRSKQWTSLSKAQASAVTSPRPSAHRKPEIYLDFRPSSSSDWFPQGILTLHGEDDEDDGHLPFQSVPRTSSSSVYDDVVVIGPEHPKPSSPPPPPSTSDDPSLAEPGHDVTITLPLPRKPAPTPIKIPHHSSKVRIERSASTTNSALKESSAPFPVANCDPQNPLRPGTVYPTPVVSANDDTSAISGTTLARALIANSFILSNENPGINRYRSGGHLARQDSATLPGTYENELLISPYWRDRRISGGEIVHFPDSGIDSSIPPVPPVLQGLSSALSHTCHLSTDVVRKPPSRNQSLRAGRLSRRLSKKPEPQPLARVTVGLPDNHIPAPTENHASGNNPTLPSPQPPSNQSTSHGNPFNHLLRIPSTSPHDPSPDLNATSSDPAAVSIGRSQLPPSLNLSSPSPVADAEGILKPRPTPNDNRDEPQRTGASSNTVQTEKTSATSGEDIAKVLHTYRFVSPLKSGFPVHLHESPDPSTPSLSPWSGGLRSHKTDTSGSMSFPQTPISAARRSQNSLSALDMGRVFAVSNTHGQRNSGPSRRGRLPIGDRPRSLQVPSSPFSRKSNESHRSGDTNSAASNPHSSGITSPDILDFMFIPSVPPVPPRPDPIKVISESLDSLEGISDRSPATTEALRQTFPETPQAFSPLFSANVCAPGASPLPTLPPLSTGTPRTPLSVAQTRGKQRKVTSGQQIQRAATLNAYRVPFSLTRALMSPIPSSPQNPGVYKADSVQKDSTLEAQQAQAAATLSVTSLDTSVDISPPVTSSPRRDSDPTGCVSGDLERETSSSNSTRPAGVSTPYVKEPETVPPDDTPSQRSAVAPPETGLFRDLLDPNAEEVEEQLSSLDSRDNNRNDVGICLLSGPSVQGSSQSKDQVRCSDTKQRPRPPNLPVVKFDNEPVRNTSGGLSGVHQEQGSAGASWMDASLKTGAVSAVPADTVPPAPTSTGPPPAVSTPASNTSGQSSPPVNFLPSPDISFSSPSPNQSLHATSHIVITSSSTLPQTSPARSTSALTPASTSSTPQVQNTAPAFPPPTLVSPPQYDRSNLLNVPSFASFLRQSYTDLVAINPPPPYQTAILSEGVSVNGQSEPPAGSGSSLPCYIHTLPNQQRGGEQPAQPTQPPQPQAQRTPPNVAPIGEGMVRERSRSVTDLRTPRNRPQGPRKLSTGQGSGRVPSLKTDRPRQGSASSTYLHTLRSGVGLGASPNSRKLSTTSTRGGPGPRFPTMPIKWRGYTLDVARWTFTSQELQEIASRAIKASAESYYVRLLKLETLDTELPEELHRLEMLTTDLKTRIRAIATARRELLDALTCHTSGMGTLDNRNLERVVEELGDITQLAEEANDKLYTVADQVAQLKRLRDVHFGSALAVSLRKLNTSFLRQAAENQLLRERVAALEAERDIAWTQAEHVAQEFDDLSTKLEQGITSNPSSTDSSARVSRVSAVRKSSIRASKSGLRHSTIGKPNPRTHIRLSNNSSPAQSSEGIPPVPSIPDTQDFAIAQPSRRRPPLIQTMNLPEPIMSPACLYSMTPTTETRAMAQAQRELCDMLGINLTDLNTLQPRPRSLSRISRMNGFPLPGLVRRNSDAKPVALKRYTRQYQDYALSPYDRELTLANLTMLG